MLIHNKEALFDGKKAFRHLRFLADRLKNRMAGTEGERKTILYIEREFKKLGLPAKRNIFKIVTYRPKRALVKVIKKKLTIAGSPVGLTRSSSKKGIKGELLFFDFDNPEYLTGDVEGKILVMPSGGLGYEKFKVLTKYRPLAVVIIETVPDRDPHRVELMPEWKGRNFPILRIGYEDGMRLVPECGQMAAVISDCREKKASSCNVVAELEGRDHPDEIIIIGGHHDSSWEGPGAADNAGGVAVVLELARVFKKIGSKRTLRFVTWGAEEFGLKGSIAYARRLKRNKRELERLKLIVNIDVQGGLIGRNEAFVLGLQDLTSSVRLLAKELGPSFTVKDSIYSSDGMSFSTMGIPSVSFARGGGSTSYLHTTKDSLRHLSADALAIQGRFIETWLRRYVSEACVFPFEKEVPKEMKKKIDDYFSKRLGVEI